MKARLSLLAVTLAAGIALLVPAAGAAVFRLSLGRPARRALPGGFVGLALEYRAIPTLVGPNPTSVDPVMVQLIRNLDPAGRPVLRIGGQSTDRSWWPVRGMSRPLGITYDLTPTWMDYAAALAQSTDARLIPSVPLEPNRPRIDTVEADQLLRYVGRRYIDAVEIGNEPELYGIVPWYRVLHGSPVPWYSKVGTPVYARPPSYGAVAFGDDFARALSALPRVAVAGPDTGIYQFMDQLMRYVSRRSPLRMLTWHSYALNQCVSNPFSPLYPSVPNLLTLRASRGLAAPVGPYAARAHAVGAGVRVDEMNSVTCNGRLGVSNTFASALWVMDAMFHMASIGVDGVNLHTFPNAANGLFDFSQAHGQWQGTVYPIYYGALMFALAAPAGSHLVAVRSSPQYQVRAWATAGADHRLRVLLINDSLHHAWRAVVSVPRWAGVRGPAALERLSARGAYATGGVTLGGQSFGARTTTGVLAAPLPAAVSPRRGAYGVTLPASTAALLTVSPGG